MFGDVISELVGVRVWPFLSLSPEETQQYASLTSSIWHVLFEWYDQERSVRDGVYATEMLA